MMQGRVFLVGAGPGDPTLFTHKMTQVLGLADVVLYDYLVHPNFRTYCSDHVIIQCVGKKKGHHLATQSEINRYIVEYAMQGKVVVRLKGGDPLLFARGREEVDTLEVHQIEYEIVPGVSSALAVPAYSGIPLTHRSLSRSVAIVTGTTATGDSISQKEYPEADTLVFLMAMTHLKELAIQLQHHQRFSEKTPVAVIQQGTLASQRIAFGTLATIFDEVVRLKVTHPALLVVGNVVSLASVWREKLPLFGKRIWLGRSKYQQRRWSDELSLMGAEVIEHPLIKIVPKNNGNECINVLDKTMYTMIIFTSRNAVTMFFDLLMTQGYDSRWCAQKTVVSIGSKTSDVLSHYGIVPDVVSEEPSAMGILSVLPKSLSDHYILLPQSSRSNQQLPDALQLRGAHVDTMVLYDTQDEVSNYQLLLMQHDYIMLMSGSQVDSFFNHCYSGETISCIVISEELKSRVQQYFDGHVIVLNEVTVDALIAAIKN